MNNHFTVTIFIITQKLCPKRTVTLFLNLHVSLAETGNVCVQNFIQNKCKYDRIYNVYFSRFLLPKSSVYCKNLLYFQTHNMLNFACALITDTSVGGMKIISTDVLFDKDFSIFPIAIFFGIQINQKHCLFDCILTAMICLTIRRRKQNPKCCIYTKTVLKNM